MLITAAFVTTGCIHTSVATAQDGGPFDPETQARIEVLQSTGGFIAVRTESIVEQGRGIVRVTIADSGPGIAPEFHARVRARFLELAAAEPARFVVLDAGLPPEVLAARIWEAVEPRLPT